MRKHVIGEYSNNPFLFRAFHAPILDDIDLHIHDFVEIVYVAVGNISPRQ